MPRSLVPVAFACLTLGCLPEPIVDLDGPRVVASTLDAGSVAVPVLPELAFEFSEPLDPTSLHRGSVALIPWELGDDCEHTPVCAEGLCVAGRCQTDPLRSGALADLEDGEYLGEDDPHFELALSAEGTRATLTLGRALDAGRRYSLVLGGGVRDRGGAGLLGGSEGAPGPWLSVLSTARAGSGGPEPRLVSPPPGREGVPTNLGRVELSFSPPVPLPGSESGASVELEAEDGGPGVILEAPEPCPGWVHGACLRLRPQTPLRPGVRYRPAGGSLVDRLGRAVVRPSAANEAWFATGEGPDLDAPDLVVADVGETRGRCVVLEVTVSEPVRAHLEVGEALIVAELPEGLSVLGAAAEASGVGEALSWTLELEDAAGNRAHASGTAVAGPSFDPAVPEGLHISEILANPLGPEPHAEFVELALAADAPGPVDLAGLILSDQSMAEIRAASQAGEAIPGDSLPAMALAPGELAVIVAQGWAPGLGDDPSPPPGTKLVVVDGSLGEGGLKNAGEPLTLWMPGPEGPISISSYGNWIDPSAAAHAGRSVVATPASDGCDLPAHPPRWRSHPLGSASPGRSP